MRRFTPDELATFLRAVNGALNEPVRLVVIGGTAIALKYDARHSTTDVDITSSSAPLAIALERAREQTGLPVPVQAVGGVVFAPDDYEERLERVSLGNLERLTVFVPEKHDLALMKVSRGLEHDLQGVEEIHRASPLQLETLLERFEQTWVVGSRRQFAISLLSALERLFGPETAAAEEVRLMGGP